VSDGLFKKWGRRYTKHSNGGCVPRTPSIWCGGQGYAAHIAWWRSDFGFLHGATIKRLALRVVCTNKPTLVARYLCRLASSQRRGFWGQGTPCHLLQKTASTIGHLFRQRNTSRVNGRSIRFKRMLLQSTADVGWTSMDATYLHIVIVKAVLLDAFGRKRSGWSTSLILMLL
jgi:hypothetical protein